MLSNRQNTNINSFQRLGCDIPQTDCKNSLGLLGTCMKFLIDCNVLSKKKKKKKQQQDQQKQVYIKYHLKH